MNVPYESNQKQLQNRSNNLESDFILLFFISKLNKDRDLLLNTDYLV